MDKRRGRPNLIKKYTLSPSSDIVAAPTVKMNVLIHLKISKKKLIDLETYICSKEHNKHDMFTKDNILPYEYDYSYAQIPIKEYNNELIVNKTDPESNLRLENMKESEESIRKNLVINSGIKYKVHKFNFNVREEWPSSTNIYCWYDGHPFSTAPIGIPERVTFKDDAYHFELSGNFCSYNCALRYLCPDNDDLNNITDLIIGDEKSNKIQMLEFLCTVETNMPANEKIKPAAQKLSLKNFGGILSIEEFRANFNQHTNFHVYKNPMIGINYNLEEIVDTINNKTELINNNMSIEEQYRRIYKLLNNKNA